MNTNKKVSREQRIATIKINNTSYISLPYLDRNELKAFIQCVMEYYDLETLEPYKTPNNTNLKALHAIFIEKEANQTTIDSILRKIGR